MFTVLLIAVGLIVKYAFGQNAKLIRGSNEFGYKLSNRLDDKDKSSNLWISPPCITSCFALVYPGSEGKTKSQIANVMGYPADANSFEVTKQFLALQSSIEGTYQGTPAGADPWTEKKSIIGIANKIYASRTLTLRQDYVDALNDGGEFFIEPAFDFAAPSAVSTINKWVNKSTNGLIDSIIAEDTDISASRLVALNAIYLNGTFRKQFETRMTSSSAFYLDASRKEKKADCHLMHQIDYFDYFADGERQFSKFPVSDSADLFLLFVLPIDSETPVLSSKATIDNALSNLESTYVALALPKLAIEATYELNEPLKDLGMRDAFNSDADFSGMSSTEKLLIDQVVHKTMVRMDEKGLVAAAVTMIVIAKMAIMQKPSPILFKADHPFQLFIIDGEHDNAILFQGIIRKPGIPAGSETPTFDESSDAIWKPAELPKKEEPIQEEPAQSEESLPEMDKNLLIAMLVAVFPLLWFTLAR